MGFFGVLQPLTGETNNVLSQEEFSIEQLDINIWVLPKVFGGSSLYCDLGIRVHAKTAVSCFDVCVPFVPSGPAVDLEPSLSNKRIASLVFGEDVRSNLNSDYHIRRGARVVPVDHPSSKTLTVVRLLPATQMAAGQKAYFRMRFELANPGGLLTWRGGGVAKRRDVLLDIRVSDFREAAFVPNELLAEQRIRPIERVNALVIAPARFRDVRRHPQLRYVRVLEGVAWEPYMERALDFTRRGKYIVYFWRSPGVVDNGTEFRGFLELSSGLAVWRAIWPAALAIIVVLFIGQGAAFWKSPWGDLLTAIGKGASSLWRSYTVIATGLTGLAGFFAIVVVTTILTGATPRWLRRLRLVLKKMSDLIYRARAGN